MTSPTIVLLTGAAQGIGFAAARQLLARGCRVFLTARQPTAGEAAVAQLGQGAEFIALDVLDDASVSAAAAALAERTGRLDVLVNNAAVLLDPDGSALTLAPEIFLQTYATNVGGVLRVTQALLPLLRKSAGARIINVSSGAGQLSDGQSSWAPAYSASKSALNMVTQQMASALPGLAVNSMCPGWCRTAMGGPNATYSAEDGADTITWLALDAPHSTTGKFLKQRAPIDW